MRAKLIHQKRNNTNGSINLTSDENPDPGSAIRIDLVGSGSVSVLRMRIRTEEQGNELKLKIKPDFQPFKMAFLVVPVPMYCRYRMFLTYYPNKVYFACQNPTFCDRKVWIRILIDPHWFGLLDPESHGGKKAGS
jgi:hypothetical protein